MELRLKSLFVLLASLCLGACATVAAPEKQPSLGEFIDQAIAAPPFDRALWGILVEEEDGRILYQKNADILMMPASNRKLFVAALTAECFGLDSTIPTELWLEGIVEQGTLYGDLVLKGFGDPSLGGRYYHDRDVVFAPLLEAVRSRGIQRILGNVIADVSSFDRESIPGSWKYDNLGSAYAPPVDALAWNENVVGVLLDARDCTAIHATTDPHFVPTQADLSCVPTEPDDEIVPQMRTDLENNLRIQGRIDQDNAAQIYIDLVAAENPGLYAAEAFDDFLRRNDIDILGLAMINVEPREWSEMLATVQSPPRYLLLGTFLKASQNLYGEMFFKAVSRQNPVSYKAARRVESAFLVNEVGLQPTDFDFADGSGLSVENYVTPRAIVKLLRHMTRPERRGIYHDLLATPGEEGTLRSRLSGLESTFRGKTGTIDGVNALSGYLIGPEGYLRYFSVIANHHIGEPSAALKIIDSIARRLADF